MPPKPEQGPRNYGVTRGPVDPRVARKGTFLKSFDIGDFASMLEYCGKSYLAMVNHGVRGQIVFTCIVKANRLRRSTWQVFLMPEGWEDEG